jgi:hypothetical protein
MGPPFNDDTARKFHGEVTPLDHAIREITMKRPPGCGSTTARSPIPLANASASAKYLNTSSGGASMKIDPSKTSSATARLHGSLHAIESLGPEVGQEPLALVCHADPQRGKIMRHEIGLQQHHELVSDRRGS